MRKIIKERQKSKFEQIERHTMFLEGIFNIIKNILSRS